MLRRYWVELGWGAFAALNFAAMPFVGEWETVPFHFVWVSLTIVYGFRVWRPWPTAGALGGVVLVSGRRWSAGAPRRWRVHADTGGLVQADAERLSYALDALIENAVKFTADDGAIAIRAWQAGDDAVIEVRDDGPGVAPELAER